jgi:hypothetical protein
VSTSPAGSGDDFFVLPGATCENQRIGGGLVQAEQYPGPDLLGQLIEPIQDRQNPALNRQRTGRVRAERGGTQHGVVRGESAGHPLVEGLVIGIPAGHRQQNGNRILLSRPF